jgi:predicted naringenin-chalcone synthase
MLIGSFRARRPKHVAAQPDALEWLAEAHTQSETLARGLGPAERDAWGQRIRRRIGRFSCPDTEIHARASVLADVTSTRWSDMTIYALDRDPHGRGSAARSDAFAEAVNAYFETEYAEDDEPPDELIHVTCTGYVAPSGAQRLVAQRGWGEATVVTHAYHMGCYAALPALRLAAGALATSARHRVDIAHTELCTLHLDPGDHSPEQLVVQSLFGDGLIRYTARPDGSGGPGLRVLALAERVLPDSAEAMQWTVSDTGLHMVLARDIPDKIAGAVRGFVDALRVRAGLTAADLGRAVFAVHPGGPKIIHLVQRVLGLTEAQVETSRHVLFDHGNMSSATLPHIWMRLAADPAVRSGTPVVSLAFGPGLTIGGALLGKQ